MMELLVTEVVVSSDVARVMRNVGMVTGIQTQGRVTGQRKGPTEGGQNFQEVGSGVRMDVNEIEGGRR